MLMDEDFQRLWSLLAELSGQLTANREHCDALKRQAEELKKQAVHTGTGYALKRFNVDLSQEQFESELERMNAQLVVENQTLQHENRQLSVLLKDYETTLEQVMSKFRSHAHSTQTHELDLVRHYESAILSALEHSSAPSTSDPLSPSLGSLPLADPHVLSSLQHLSGLVHRALKSLQGEEDPEGSRSSSSSSDDEDDGDGELGAAGGEEGPAFATLQRTDSVVPSQAPSSPPQPYAASASSSLLSPAPAQLPLYMPRLRDVSSGGYIGTRGTALTDPALRSAIELEQLRLENAQLRELLGIAKELGAAEASSSAATAGAGREGHGAIAASRTDGDGGAGEGMEVDPATARTGAGVVVPEELIKGAEIDAMAGRSSDGVLSDSQI